MTVTREHLLGGSLQLSSACPCRCRSCQTETVSVTPEECRTCGGTCSGSEPLYYINEDPGSEVSWLVSPGPCPCETRIRDILVSGLKDLHLGLRLLQDGPSPTERPPDLPESRTNPVYGVSVMSPLRDVKHVSSPWRWLDIPKVLDIHLWTKTRKEVQIIGPDSFFCFQLLEAFVIKGRDQLIRQLVTRSPEPESGP